MTLGEPRVPKPGNQGGVKLPRAKAPITSHDSTRKPRAGTVKSGKRNPGVGGSGKTSNNVPRT